MVVAFEAMISLILRDWEKMEAGFCAAARKNPAKHNRLRLILIIRRNIMAKLLIIHGLILWVQEKTNQNHYKNFTKY